MQEDDFIEDDGVGGYADNGMDDWDDPTRKMDEGDDDDSKISKLVPLRERETNSSELQVNQRRKPRNQLQ